LAVDVAFNIPDDEPAGTRAGDELVFKGEAEISPLVRQGAAKLIDYHQRGNSVLLKSWGTPDVVFGQIAAQLAQFHPVAIAEEMAQELVAHAENHAMQFRTKHAANVIGVKMEVAETDPEGQFETGALETQRIDAYTERAQVAGSAGQEVRLTSSGTATTSNRADVGAIFASIKKWSLWLKFEAPDRNELESIANDQALAALAQLAEGGLSPEEMQEIIDHLESLAEQGLLSQDVMDILKNMQEIQALSLMDSSPEIEARIQALSEQIHESLIKGIEEGSIPPNILSQVVEAISAFAEKNDIAVLLPEDVLQTIDTKIKIEVIKQQLGDIAQGMEIPEDRAAIESLIEELEGLDGQDLIDHLETIQETLGEMEIPADLKAKVDVVLEAAQEVSETVKAQLPEPGSIEALAEMSADDLMAMIENLDNIDFDSLSAEQQEVLADLREILEQLDVENLSVEELKEALAGVGEPELVEAVKNLVLEIQKEPVQLAMPQEALNETNKFLNAHSDLAEKIVVQSVIDDLKTSLESMEPESEQAQQVQEVIEKLEAGEPVENIDPAVLEQVAEVLGDQAPQALSQAVETITQAQTENVVLAGETLEKISLVTSDLESVKAELEALIEDGAELSPEQAELAEKIDQVIEALKEDPANIEALAELSSLDAQVLDSLKEMMPAETAVQIDNLVQSIDETVSIQQEALAIKHDVTTTDIQNAAEVVGVLNANADALEAAGFDADTIEQIKQTLNEDLTSTESLAELAKVQNALNDIAPESADSMKALIETQITKVSESTGVERPVVEQAVQTVSDLSSAIAGNKELQTLLESKGVNIDDIVTNLGKAEGVVDAARLAVLAETMPDLRQAMPDLVERAENIMRANAEITADKMIAEGSALDRTEITQAVIDAGRLAAEVSTNETLKNAMEAAGFDVDGFVESVQKDPMSMEAATEVQELRQRIEESNLAPEEKAAMLDRLDGLQETQVEATAERLGIEPEAARNVINLTVDMKSMSPEAKEALAEAGVDVDQLVERIQREPVAPEVQQMLQEMKDFVNDPDVSTDIRADIEARIERVVDAQVDVIAERLGVEPDVVREINSFAEQVGDLSQDTQNLLAEAGVDVEQAIQTIQDNPTSPEAVEAIRQVSEVLQNPDIAAQITPSELSQLQDAVRDYSQAAQAIENSAPSLPLISPDKAPALVEAMENARGELTAAGIDPEKVIQAFTSPDMPMSERAEIINEVNQNPEMQRVLEQAGVSPEDMRAAHRDFTGMQPEPPRVVAISPEMKASLPVVAAQMTAIANQYKESGSILKNQENSARDRAIAQNLEKGVKLAEKIERGEPVSKREVETTLRQMDTAINAMPEGPEKTQVTQIRQEMAKPFKDDPRVDQKLVEKPGPGNCPPPCNCHPKNDHSRAANDNSGNTPTVITTIETAKGKVRVEHTPEEIKKSQQAYEDLVGKGKTDKAPSVSQEKVREAIEAAKANPNSEKITDIKNAFKYEHDHGPGCGCGDTSTQSTDNNNPSTSSVTAPPVVKAEAIDTSLTVGNGKYSIAPTGSETSSLFNSKGSTIQVTGGDAGEAFKGIDFFKEVTEEKVTKVGGRCKGCVTGCKPKVA